MQEHLGSTADCLSPFTLQPEILAKVEFLQKYALLSATLINVTNRG